MPIATAKPPVVPHVGREAAAVRGSRGKRVRPQRATYNRSQTALEVAACARVGESDESQGAASTEHACGLSYIQQLPGCVKGYDISMSW
mmetsp:Transcript_13971/g.37279  ORF Transcript_13971/g.37279 Transcript_13971/m.37279 type:complete len:89 (+) Transcript_13971:2140-2406(+)|eukprot:728872-Pelagomonas_calceolata.AAC.7